MAHFAEIGLNNEVIRVVVVSNDILLDENHVEQESKGCDFCRNTFGGVWLQTSYNGSIRKNFAASGFFYNADLDAFIPPKPLKGWVLDESDCVWVAPHPKPDDESQYFWDEEAEDWALKV